MNMFRLTVALLIVIGCAVFGLPWAVEGSFLQDAAAQELGHEAAHGEAAHGDAAHGDGEHGLDGHGDSHASHGNSNPLSVDPDLALFSLIVFVILLAVLWRFAWGPIRDALDEREQSIADQIAEAAKSRDEARRLMEEHEAKLASAQDEIRGLMEEARRDAEAQKLAIISEAEAAAASQRELAIRDIETAKVAALQDLAKSEVRRMVDLAGRIVGKELKAEDHASMVADAVRRLPSDN